MLSAAFEDSWQRMATLVSLVVLASTYGAALLMGGWTRAVLWTQAVTHLVLGQLLVLHATPMTGPSGAFEVFAGAEANRVASPIFALTGAGIILSGLYDCYREWARVRPAPEAKAARRARSVA